KAYLCHAKIKKIKPGDIVLFYKSIKEQGITTIGVAEKIHYNITAIDKALNLVGKRTVYSKHEIKKLIEKPTTIILFNFHFHFDRIIPYEFLEENKILKGPPQSILEIDNDNYQIIKKEGRLDERFTFD
ncbi:MAG: EVE domain-containing protein, partial [Promethearchaeota archaeon]